MRFKSIYLIIGVFILLYLITGCSYPENKKVILPSDSLVCSVINDVVAFDSLYSKDSIPVFHLVGTLRFERDLTPPPPDVYSKIHHACELRNLFCRVNYKFTASDSIYFLAQTDSAYSARKRNGVKSLPEQFVKGFKIVKRGNEGKETKYGRKLIVFHLPLFTENFQYAFVQYDIIDGFFGFYDPEKEKDQKFPAYRLILKNRQGKWVPLLYDRLR